MKSRGQKILFSLIIALGFFIAIELGLHVVGFHFQRSLSYMRFAFPDPDQLHNVFIPDPELIWRMRPGYDFGPDFQPLNAKGFRGPDVERSIPERTIRIACLGDSVTFGHPLAHYPALFERELTNEVADLSFEVMNFGVPGYSSWQGLKLLEGEALSYHPDIVIALFGWNDHWLARGFSDHEQVVGSSPMFGLKEFLGRSRVYQVVNFMVYKAQSLTNAESMENVQKKLRVPRDQFRANLTEIVKICKSRGIPVILITAPDAIGLEPLPDFYSHLEFIEPGANLADLHASYVEIVREVAGEQSVGLLDAHALFADLGPADYFSDPAKDVVHLNVKGLELFSRVLAEAALALPDWRAIKEDRQ